MKYKELTPESRIIIHVTFFICLMTMTALGFDLLNSASWTLVAIGMAIQAFGFYVGVKYIKLIWRLKKQ